MTCLAVLSYSLDSSRFATCIVPCTDRSCQLESWTSRVTSLLTQLESFRVRSCIAWGCLSSHSNDHDEIHPPRLVSLVCYLCGFPDDFQRHMICQYRRSRKVRAWIPFYFHHWHLRLLNPLTLPLFSADQTETRVIAHSIFPSHLRQQ